MPAVGFASGSTALLVPLELTCRQIAQMGLALFSDGSPLARQEIISMSKARPSWVTREAFGSGPICTGGAAAAWPASPPSLPAARAHQRRRSVRARPPAARAQPRASRVVRLAAANVAGSRDHSAFKQGAAILLKNSVRMPESCFSWALARCSISPAGFLPSAFSCHSCWQVAA
jgi:hypothetical protein